MTESIATTNHPRRRTAPPESAVRAIFTPRELAKHLGLSEPTVYRMLKRGEIPRRMAGKKYIIPKSAVEIGRAHV
jgi:excisionase family DNA binding protein